MSAAAIGQTQISNVVIGCTIDNGLTNHYRRVLLLESPSYMNRQLSLRIQCINHETVSGIDHVFITKIQDNYLALYPRQSLQLLFELLLLFEIQRGTFLHIRQL